MKRSRIFLGVTTGLLAIAGVAAAKRFDSQRTRFYCTAGINKYCVSAGLSQFTYSGVTTDPIATVTFTEGTSHTVPLYTNGTAGQLCSTTNCIHTLYYSDTN